MPIPYSPPWFEHAKKDYKLTEVTGSKYHNDRIVEMHSFTTLKAKDDETPWCSSAMNAWMIESGFKGTNSAAAVSWEKYGVAVKLNSLLLGDIVVLKRGTGWQRHVAFYAGQRRRSTKGNDQVLLYGGNQKDAVNYQWYDVGGITAIRRPKGYNPPDGIAATNVKPLVQSKTLAGAAVSTAGTAVLSAEIMGVVDKVSQLSLKVDTIETSVNNANKLVGKLITYVDYLPYIGIGMLFIGLGLTVYARLSDRWKGLN